MKARALNKKNDLHPVVYLADEITRLNGRLASLFAESSRAPGLTRMETIVLISVAEAKSAPTVPQIGRSLGHPRQVIQRAANKLIAAALLETISNPGHKRAPLLRIIEAGLRTRNELSARAVATADSLLQEIDPVRCRQLAGGLHALRTDIETYVRKHA